MASASPCSWILMPVRASSEPQPLAARERSARTRVVRAVVMGPPAKRAGSEQRDGKKRGAGSGERDRDVGGRNGLRAPSARDQDGRRDPDGHCAAGDGPGGPPWYQGGISMSSCGLSRLLWPSRSCRRCDGLPRPRCVRWQSGTGAAASTAYRPRATFSSAKARPLATVTPTF